MARIRFGPDTHFLCGPPIPTTFLKFVTGGFCTRYPGTDPSGTRRLPPSRNVQRNLRVNFVILTHSPVRRSFFSFFFCTMCEKTKCVTQRILRLGVAELQIFSQYRMGDNEFYRCTYQISMMYHTLSLYLLKLRVKRRGFIF